MPFGICTFTARFVIRVNVWQGQFTIWGDVYALPTEDFLLKWNVFKQEMEAYLVLHFWVIHSFMVAHKKECPTCGDDAGRQDTFRTHCT